MSIYQAVLLAVALAGLAFLTARVGLHAFLALILIAVAYGLGADMAVTFIGQSITIGFTQTVEALGLVIVAASIAATFAERTGAAAAFARRWPRGAGIWVPLGLVSGLCASISAAFALLAPMQRAVAGAPVPRQAATLALALLAGHALILPAPGPVAAAAILQAPLVPVFALGAPLAILLALLGGALARRAVDVPPPPRSDATVGPWLVIVPLLLPLVFLFVQSIGQIPSEPLGGGHTREFLIGIGRPAFLLAASVAATLLLARRWRPEIVSEKGWVGEAAERAASLLLITGAAGAFAKVLQNTGMPELMAERLLDLPLGGALTLLVPFLAAATMKMLQGSSIVAVLTAAGMMEPLLAPLGLEADWGRALAVAAIGAGSITASHVNDPYFWLVDGHTRLGVAATLRLFSLASLLQGLAGIGLLILAGAVLL
ncbi:GntT/GntP/DsdX family permease [Desertibaculum subflavum]|uniref:GntT/GntP/DsdX family permease n=1 Tax=Desertibaculum subflavum TaxID=2268458 RepID=UPI000E66E72F